MKKVLTEIIAAYAKTISECSITYKLDRILLFENKNQSKIEFSLLGTGKKPFPRELLKVYDSDLLYQFRPQDIKVISTAATLINNDVIFKELDGFDLTSKSPTVQFKSKLNKERTSYKLFDILKKPEILKDISGYEGYFLANLMKEINLKCE